MSRIKTKPVVASSKGRQPARGASQRKAAKTAKTLSRAAVSTDKPITRSKEMNEQFTRQAQDMFKAAQDARIPENLQAMAEDGVAKSREAYQKMNSAAKDNAKAVEDMMLAAQAGAKAIGEKVMQNTADNTEAVFDAAQAMARARTLPEAARLQADFMQQQFAIAGAQTKELLELSAKFTRDALETMNAAASKALDQFRR